MQKKIPLRLPAPGGIDQKNSVMSWQATTLPFRFHRSECMHLQIPFSFDASANRPAFEMENEARE